MSPAVPADRLELRYPAGPPPMDATPDCAAVVVGGRYTRDVARAYAGTGVQVVTRVDGPEGLGKPTVRQIAAVAAAKDNADAVELAAPAPLLAVGAEVALRDDLAAVVAAAREVRSAVVVRVVIDSASVPGDLPVLSAAVRASGADALVWAGPVSDAAGWLAVGADRVAVPGPKQTLVS